MEDGFEFGGNNTPIYDFILYKNVTHLRVMGTTAWVYCSYNKSDPVKIMNESVEHAKADVEEIRIRVQKWLRRNAVKREEKRVRHAEEREFRASLLAQLGKLTERISFDPDIGDEALDAVERCKKRAREGGE